MRKVVVFGDSLTRSARVPEALQWPAVLERALGGSVRVVNEGLGGRTTAFDIHGDRAKNGLRDLRACLQQHSPLDLLIVMLGSNDLKPEAAGTATLAAEGLRRLIDSIETERALQPAMRLLIVAPPVFAVSDLPDGKPRGGRSVGESRLLAPLYAQIANATGASFIDAAAFAQASRRDGVHLDEPELNKLAMGLLPTVRSLLA
jgi:lysophospholipase L1-like esterase